MRCSYQYYLRYVRGFPPQPGANLLWGKLGHEIIQLAYHGVPLDAAHYLVWDELASPILDELDKWYALDCELHRVKETSEGVQAYRTWLESNPRYGELAASVAEFQRTVLGAWRWEARPLTKFYRWSRVLALLSPGELLLPDPLLVEGEWLAPPPSAVQAAPGNNAFGAGKKEEEVQVRWLQGKFDEVPVPVVGVPDVIARLGEGLLFADYKFSRIARQEDIEQDLQLLLYVELARQSGIVLPGQPVWVGHIYPTEKGEVVKVLAGTALHALLLPELRQLFRDMARDVAEERYRRVRGIDHFSVAPCALCDMAYLCDPGREAPLLLASEG